MEFFVALFLFLLLSGMLPLPLANDSKEFLIDKKVKVKRGFQTFCYSEDICSIQDFSPDSMCILALVTVEQMFIFIKKFNTLRRNDGYVQKNVYFWGYFHLSKRTPVAGLI